MQFLLSVHHEIAADGSYSMDLPAGVDAQTVFDAVDMFNKDLERGGAWVFAGGLEPPTAASVVDASNGDLKIVDGPPRGHEFMGGFWVIAVPDRETALDWASRASAACQQPVQVRPFQGE